MGRTLGLAGVKALWLGFRALGWSLRFEGFNFGGLGFKGCSVLLFKTFFIDLHGVFF